ncbi:MULTISPECIES: cation-translocating P-type ATPase [Cyanophyceae]|uniref:Cation-transporting P-type ATPase n=1 Tax=Leptolyngbya subtilissima DQ-A4 TaxID=2933933 RepID=A0ABV0KBH2_9CYAN|nr:cation-transporting P-type ATPase [Nodosilinea sp. FACHB-141]MBD2115068.1 cation-transporting P-type ATPase [Nodosilinea sp. FACHB-141]
MAVLDGVKSTEQQWHHLSQEQVVQLLKTDPEQGLSFPEAAERHDRFGHNELTAQKKQSAWVRFLQQFNQPLLYILLVAGLVTAFLQEWIDSGVIFGVTLLNAIIGFVQESKAEDAIAALSEAVTTDATIHRNGQKQVVSSGELVPGDLVLLSSGDKVPADLRLLEIRDLQVDESALTGESVPVEKNLHPLEADTPLAERTNMVYTGSLVTFGQARGVVVGIGEMTETGHLSQLMQRSTAIDTPLTRKIDKFSRTLLYVILGLAALTFAVGVAQGFSWIEVFKAAVALAVSAIPEGLPAILTVTLAIGVSQMAKHHAIIRKLPAIETLGSTTVICSDKTGTLTENQMTVQEIDAGGRRYRVSGGGYAPDGEIFLNRHAIDLAKAPALYECLQAGLLCNDSHLEVQDGNWTVVGSPTEGALVAAAHKAGLSADKLEQALPRLDTLPFESQFQYMATLHRNRPERLVYLKGSAEATLKRCRQMLGEDGEAIALNPTQVEQTVESMAKKGLRVLALARKVVPDSQSSIEHSDLEQGLVFLGLQGMIDPPRPEAIQAIESCKSAGIQVKMITGDHAKTAAAIAQQMGLNQTENAPVLTGQELAQLDEQGLTNAVAQSHIFARVAPEQKLRIVEALQSKGEIVAMTGDGVNDAPALKQADIGVAMGITGTEVTKEAADMILTDDNFASIEKAVEEGRTVYKNLLRAIAFILPVNGGESMTILIAVMLATPLPILPVQILWLNMVSSVVLSLPLAFEPPSPDVMQHPPRSVNEPLLSRRLISRILTVSLFNWIVIFGTFNWFIRTTGNEDLARTMAIQALVAAEAFYLLGISRFIPAIVARLRGKDESLSYAVAIGIAGVFILQLLFSQWSLMNRLFATEVLTLTQGLICLGLGLPMIALAALLKRFAPLT